MTGQTYPFREALFFPLDEAGKEDSAGSVKEWAEIGVPEEWVYVLRRIGFNLISDIAGEKPQGLQQKIGDVNKKYKLGYEKPSVDDIQTWIDAAKAVSETASVEE